MKLPIDRLPDLPGDLSIGWSGTSTGRGEGPVLTRRLSTRSRRYLGNVICFLHERGLYLRWVRQECHGTLSYGVSWKHVFLFSLIITLS